MTDETEVSSIQFLDNYKYFLVTLRSIILT